MCIHQSYIISQMETCSIGHVSKSRVVIPAKAGIHIDFIKALDSCFLPAFAGMTEDTGNDGNEEPSWMCSHTKSVRKDAFDRPSVDI